MTTAGETSGPWTVAVDAMGGYNAPNAVVRAIAKLSTGADDRDVFFTLVGDEARLTDALYQESHNPERINIVHSPTVVGMGEPAKAAVEQRPDCSIATACRLVAEGEADAVVTAGHPGAAIVCAHHHFSLLSEVEKAALAAAYPTARDRDDDRDRFSLILDVGATLRAEPDDLVSFAVMGAAYANIVTEVDQPRVALLSVSRESTIGPPEVVEAYGRLRDHPAVNFYGNVEGHEILRGDHDVVVCEGFVGDITLKLLEGTGEAAFDLAQAAYESKLAWRMGLRLLSGGLKKIKTAIDFEEYGGAPLLGIDRVMILSHPRSRTKAIANATKLAVKNVRARLPETIAERLGPSGEET